MKNTTPSILFCFIAFISVSAQTGSFTYQGKLTDNLADANGAYDLIFTLYDAPAGGTQIGIGQFDDLNVVSGVFTVTLNFSASAFLSGEPRFLELQVRPGASTGAYTLLSPRKQITSAPHSMRSLSAAEADNLSASCIGCVTSPQIGSLPSGSGSYIQNQYAGAQASSNFNISGTGTANVFNAATQYNLSGARILGAGTNSVFVGFNTGTSSIGDGNSFVGNDAGIQNSSGSFNSFFGRSAGSNNTTGGSNSFYGAFSGLNNTTGGGNSFFGSSAGDLNQVGSGNSYFGQNAGRRRTGNNNSVFGNAISTGGALAGDFNAFFGHRAGESTSGNLNTFIGTGAGIGNASGSSNTFVGHDAGSSNFIGSFNSALGELANFVSGDLTNATAIGYRAVAAQNNSLVLGSISGVNGCNAGNTCGSVNVGIGTTTPTDRLHVVGNTLITGQIKNFAEAGDASFYMKAGLAANGIYFRVSSNPGSNSRLSVSQSDGTNFQERLVVDQNGAVVATNKLQVGGDSFGVSSDQLAVFGSISFATLGAVGSTQLCRNASNQIASCSSSLRYKTNISQFSDGLSFVNKLRPISFDWRDGGMRDVGFGAEDVAKIDPRFVTYNEKGEVEGVKYDRLTTVLVNAIKEQQTQIDTLQKTNAQQQTQIDEQQRQINQLKNLICSITIDAEVCKTKEKD